MVCPPKTDRSVRLLALDHVCIVALRCLRAAHAREVFAGAEPTGFVFANRHGRPLSPGYLTHTFRRLVEQASLPPIRLHDLRHGAASLSLAAGNDLKTVQDLLGHESIVLTADTYTSVMPCLARQAAEATANLVLQASARTSRPIRGGQARLKRESVRRARRTAVSPRVHRPRRSV